MARRMSGAKAGQGARTRVSDGQGHDRRDGGGARRPAPQAPGRAARPGKARLGILTAAAREIARHGYHGMSMRDLAKATGRSLASYYSHFSSKEDVLFALQREAFETLVGAARESLQGIEDVAARLYVFILNHVRYFAEHPDVMRVLIQEAAALPPERRRVVRALKEAYFHIAREIVGEIAHSGCGRKEVKGSRSIDALELDRSTYSIFGMLNWVYGWYEPERHGPPPVLARTIHRIALCGLVTHCPYREMQDVMDRQIGSLSLPPPIRSDRTTEETA